MIICLLMVYGVLLIILKKSTMLVLMGPRRENKGYGETEHVVGG